MATESLLVDYGEEGRQWELGAGVIQGGSCSGVIRAHPEASAAHLRPCGNDK